jgi:type IV secretory pathway TraG/TraD family ATPase VirD4
LETTSIFISVPEGRLETYSTVITMMITQMTRYLERRPEQHTPEGAKSETILVMLDEFPRLGKIEVVETATSTLRSKKVTIALVFQSLAQLDKIYSKETRRIILDNCDYKVIFGAADAETQRYFSDLSGTHLVAKRSDSVHYDDEKKMTGRTAHTDQVRERRIEPHEFATLTDIVFISKGVYSKVKKVPYYKEDGIEKFRTGVQKILITVASWLDRKVLSLWKRLYQK